MAKQEPRILPPSGITLDDDDDDILATVRKRPETTSVALTAPERNKLVRAAKTDANLNTVHRRAPAPRAVKFCISMPAADHAVLEELRDTAMEMRIDAGLSGIARLGVQLVAELPRELLEQRLREMLGTPRRR